MDFQDILELLMQLQRRQRASNIGPRGENRGAPSTGYAFNEQANEAARQRALITQEVPSSQYQLNQQANQSAREQARRFKQPTSEYQMNEWRKRQGKRNLNFRTGGGM